MTAECGKPIAEARGEVAYGASFVEWFAEEGKRAYGESIPSPSSDRRLLTIRQPIGVCAAITPWNFPLAMITRKVAPALAAGCTVVVKPAEQTPLTALALARLAHDAALPAGIFNVLTGDPLAIGGALTASPVVRKLSFTGSTEVGRLLMAQCCADDQEALARTRGQRAVHRFRRRRPRRGGRRGNRCQVPQHRPDLRLRQPPAGPGGDLRALRRATRKPRAVAQGRPGQRGGRRAGAADRRSGLAKVEAHIADAVACGARVVTGGRRMSAAAPSSSRRCSPT
jgi:succinate-semialdehyde dehydrogenase/glutarate-semialdehyde dehydrogenase